ncbi:MAG: DUF4309 domain-containing protein [Nitrospirae bacterium]|nr:MAG: DUF4309 domain-containing protein [Nitrospirota bacterium]
MKIIELKSIVCLAGLPVEYFLVLPQHIQESDHRSFIITIGGQVLIPAKSQKTAYPIGQKRNVFLRRQTTLKKELLEVRKRFFNPLCQIPHKLPSLPLVRNIRKYHLRLIQIPYYCKIFSVQKVWIVILSCMKWGKRPAGYTNMLCTNKMKKQLITAILMGCFIVLCSTNASGKTNKHELLKALHASASKGESYVANGITLNSQLKEIKKKFGEPKDKQDDEWGALFVYDSFSILFSGYLSDLNDSSEILELRIFIGNDHINYKDIIKTLGKPNHEEYNDAEQRWQAFYKAGDNCLAFFSDGKESQMFEAAIFKPAAEFKKKQFKKLK